MGIEEIIGSKREEILRDYVDLLPSICRHSKLLLLECAQTRPSR